MAGLLAFTNLFWAYLTMTLVNKLMSRNYHEYVVSRAAASPPERFNPQEYRVEQEESGEVHVPL